VTAPAERAFACFPRGQLRDELLASFRVGLRSLRNPETGNTFTEDEIARATQRGSRWWIEADGLDLVLLSQQGRGIWLAQQIRPERAASSFLHGYHGELWGESRLPAAGGSGTVLATLATPGTVFHGSTTIPDPGALTARDQETGLRFQVFVDATADGDGEARVQLVGIDTGVATNLKVGAVIAWESPPLGAAPTATVVTPDFSGGRDIETDAEFSDRLKARIRHKPASGNRAHFRAWARDTSSRVHDAFVYPCAVHAGSVVVCVLEKRSTAGPNALQASAFVRNSVRDRLVPPGSPVVPERVFVVVTTFTPEPSDLLLRVGLPRENAGGWIDVHPWPGYVTTPASVLTVTDTRHFTMHSDLPPPAGTTPAMAWWDRTTGKFVRISQPTIGSGVGSTYTIALSDPLNIQAGDWICPAVSRSDELSSAIEEYFDSLGPGEVIAVDLDTRGDRAMRFPEQTEESPPSAGVEVIEYLRNALGGALAGVIPTYSVMTPTLPDNPIDGPHKLTLGRLGIYPLPL
jgi:hypothetical protein